MIADTMMPEAFETAHDFAGLITVLVHEAPTHTRPTPMMPLAG